MYVRDTKIRLTDFEFSFINYLIDRKGYCELLQFQQYLHLLNGKEVSKYNVVVYVNRLRKKISYHTKDCLIKTRYGKGYYIDN
jgi:DNA-binding response OmpR family regulator